MKNINKLFATLIMVITLSYSSAFSQNESITIKSTGKMRIFDNGKLKINSASGKIRTSGTGDPNVKLDNLGEIQFNGTNNTFTYNPNDVCEDDVSNPDDPTNVLALGQSADTRINGLVSYTGGATAQDVQARYYTDLAMDGTGSKNIPTGVVVSGEYTAPGSGARTYTGDFTYDGTTDQTILDESGAGPSSGAYDNVILQGAGVKTLADNTTADMTNLTIDPNTGNVVVNGSMNVAGVVTQDATNTISIAGVGANTGTLTLNGTDPSTLAGNVNVGDNGNFAMGTGALATVTGTLALGDFADAKITLADNSELTISGSMTNAHTAGVNTDFGDASTVIYNGAAGQVVMATTEANDYGNLTISGADEKTAIGTVAVGGNFNLQDANFDLGNCDPTNLAFLWLTDQTANATYGNGTPLLSPFEVVGRVRRTIGGSTSDLTFNNYATKVAIANPTNVNWIELCVNPGATGYVNGFDVERDLKRTIKYGYDVVSASTDWAAAITYGYKPDELEVSKRTEAFQKSLRFRETDPADPSLDQKVSTTEKITRDIDVANANPFNSARLAAIRPTGGRVAPQTLLAEVADDNLLFLRGGPAEFISVADGRWSNPGTWDEGEQPGPLDIVKIRTNVHIGFERDGIDGTTPAGQIDENIAIADKGEGDYTNRSTIAALIEINDKFGSSVPGEDSEVATLIVGGTEQVGITRYTAAQADLEALLTGTKSGSILIKQPKIGSTEDYYADLTTFNNAATAMETDNKRYNAGLFVRENAILKLRNTICIEGIVNNGGEVNVDEAD